MAVAALAWRLAVPAAGEEGRELDPRTKAEAYRAVIGRGVRDPSLTSPVGAPEVDIQLTTEKKNNKAKAAVGLRLGDDFFIDVKFIAPLGEGDAEAEPIDMDGLGRSAVVDAGFRFLAWNPRLDADAAAEVEEEYRRRHPPSSSIAGRERRSDPVTLLMLRDEPDLRRRFLEAVEWGSAYFAACRVKIGREGFTWAGADLREISEQKTHKAAEAAAGVLTPRWGYFGINLEYQAFFDGAAATELILPYGQDGNAWRIEKIALRTPSRRERLKIQVEHRKSLTDRVAINPKLSYFPGERVLLAELPVYLFRNPDEGLNGGVNLSWTSKSGGRFGMGIFIGTSFSIFPY
jgi:hypothetical protein